MTTKKLKMATFTKKGSLSVLQHHKNNNVQKAGEHIEQY